MNISIMMMNMENAMDAKNVLREDRRSFHISIQSRQPLITRILSIDMTVKREIHLLIMIRLSKNSRSRMRLSKISKQHQWSIINHILLNQLPDLIIGRFQEAKEQQIKLIHLFHRLPII